MPDVRALATSAGFADWDYGRVMRRGACARKQVKTTNHGKPYTVQIKVEWVESPDTHRKREHAESHEFEAKTI